MTGRRWMAACVASAAVAYVLGARGGDPPVAPAAARAPVVSERVVEVARGEAGGLTRDDVRAVIREELAARADGAPPAPAAAHDDGDAPDPVAAAARARALAAAHAAVDDGGRDGVWDARDREVLRAQLGHLGPAEAAEVLSPLFRAINDQRIQLEVAPL